MSKRKGGNQRGSWNPLQTRRQRLKFALNERDHRLMAMVEKGETISRVLFPLIKQVPVELKKPHPNAKMIKKCEFLALEGIKLIADGTRHFEKLVKNMRRQKAGNLSEKDLSEKLSEAYIIADIRVEQCKKVLREIQDWKSKNGIEW